MLGYKPSVGKTTSGSPVELEGTSAVRDGGSVEVQSLSSGGRGLELDEAVSGVTVATVSKVEEEFERLRTQRIYRGSS